MQLIDGKNQTNRFVYDLYGRLFEQYNPAGAPVLANSYDDGGNVVRPNGSPWVNTYAYHALSRLESIVNSVGTFSYFYQSVDAGNAKGSLLRKIGFPNGAYVTNTFNNMGQLLSTILKSGAGVTLNSHSYSNNVAGQITRHTRLDGVYTDFGYDDVGQLKKA